MRDQDKSKETLISELQALREEVDALKGLAAKHKQTEAALRQSEANLAHAQRIAHVGSWRWDIITGANDWSDEFFRICGLTPGEIEPDFEQAIQLIHPEDREAAVAAARRAVETGNTYYIEKRIVRPDGSERHVMAQGEVIYDDNHQPIAMIGTFLDITARKQAEATLQRYTKRLEILNEIGRAILAVRSPQAIAQAALHYLKQLLPCNRLSITEVNIETGQIIFLAIISNQLNKPQNYRSFTLKNFGTLFEKFKQGHINIVKDLPALSGLSAMQEKLLAEGIHTYVNVPLLIQGELIGMLNLGAAQPDAFTAEHLVIAREVADQLAVALHHARLYQAEQQARHTAEVLRAANLALTQILDLNVVLETLCDYLSQLVIYDQAEVLLKQPNAELVVEARRSYQNQTESEQDQADLSDPQMYPLIYTSLQTHQSLLISDLGQCIQTPEGKKHNPLHSLVITPLIAGGKAIGVCVLGKAEPNFFDLTHLHLVEALAAQAAVAIQNAQLFAQVRIGREQLQAISERLVEVQEHERRSIARELHDEFGQILTGLKLVLEANTGIPLDKVKANLTKAQNLVNELMTRVRKLSLGLQPLILNDLGLLPTLLWHFERYTEQTNIHVIFKHTGLERRFRPKIETTAYRVVQEGLTNVARHAEASQVEVQLWADDEMLMIQIEDQGQGFSVEDTLAFETAIGLQGMRERVALLSGQLLIESAMAQGTRLTATLPLSP